MNRPTIDATMMAVVFALAARASCRKRQVGCVLTDAFGRILATGYNGRPRGLSNCDDDPCAQCDGVHAEISALLNADSQQIHTCYTNFAPCWHCVKALVNTSCSRLVCNDTSTWEPRSAELWAKLGRHYEIR